MTFTPVSWSTYLKSRKRCRSMEFKRSLSQGNWQCPVCSRGRGRQWGQHLRCGTKSACSSRNTWLAFRDTPIFVYCFLFSFFYLFMAPSKSNDVRGECRRLWLVGAWCDTDKGDRDSVAIKVLRDCHCNWDIHWRLVTLFRSSDVRESALIRVHMQGLCE